MNRHERLLGLIEAATSELAAAEGEIVEVEAKTKEALAVTAADRAEGIIDADEEAARRDALLAELNEARNRADTLRHGLPELRQRLADEDEQRRRRDLGQLRATHLRAQQAMLGAAKALARPLRDAAHASHELERHRSLEAEAHDAVAAIISADDEPLARVDEPWNADPELLAFLTAGPKRPNADATAAAAQQKAAQARQDAEALAWFRTTASTQALAQLAPHLHERAHAILLEVEAARELERERIRAAEKARAVPRI